jgi:hypothetical protein
MAVAQTMKILGRTVVAMGLLLSIAMLPYGQGHTVARASSGKATVPPLTLAYTPTSGDWSHRFSPFASGLFVDGAI